MSEALISEMFVSVQGEGRAMGVPMAFVRLAHCNIDCVWCDTPQRKQGQKIGLNAVHQAIRTMPVRHVCFTGGEPMLQFKRISKLLEWLAKDGYQLHLETNGTINPGDHLGLLSLFHVITVSPKLPSAQHHNPASPLEERPVFIPKSLRAWADYAEISPAVSFKWVLEDNDEEWAAFADQLAMLPSNAEVFVQPQSYQPDVYARFGVRILHNINAGWPGSTLPQIRYMPRFHELMWGDAPGR